MLRLVLRITAALAALGVAVVGAMSVERVPLLSGQLTTLSGDPLAGAYVAYSYKGSRFNFVDSSSYYRPGEVLRTNDTAAYEIPGFIEIHPPLDSGLVPWIEWVYVPELHHFFGPIAPLSETIPGLMERDTEPGVVRLADLSDDPQRWSQTIRRLDTATRNLRYWAREEQPRMLAAEPLLEELSAHLRQEYRSFMQRHANTPRPPPEVRRAFYMTEEEWQERQRSAQEDLARDPLWGQRMERLWPELAGPSEER